MTSDSRNSKLGNWWPIYLAAILLMVVTVSPPQDFSPAQSLMSPNNLTRLKLVTRALSAILLLIVLVQVARRQPKLSALLMFTPLFVLGLWALASSTWSALPRITINQAGSFGILTLLGCAIGWRWSSTADTERMLKLLSIVLLFISLALLALRFVAPQYGALTRNADGLMHSTGASATASLGLLIPWLALLIWKHRWAARLVLVSTPVQALTILLAGNRLSLLLTLLVGGLALLLTARKDRLAVAALGIGICGTIYLLADPETFVLDRGLSSAGLLVRQGQTTAELATLSGRTEMWTAMLRSFSESPWKGHGYFVTSRTGQIYVWYEWGNWTAHNMWLQLLVTSGLVGVAIFALHLLLVLAGTIGLARQRSSESRCFLVFFCLMATWYLGWGMLNASIFGPTIPESVIFFVITGLFVGQVLGGPTSTSLATEAA